MMPSVFEIRDVNAFVWFAVWVLAITALTKAVFRSFLAAELTWWLRARSEGRERRINQLNWEVHHRLKYDPDLASGNPHAAKQPLSDEEVHHKRAELVALARGTFGQRMLNWFLGCTACQSFWLAVIAYSLARGFDGLVPLAASALAYSSGVVLLSAFLGPSPSAAERNAQPVLQVGQRSCKGCGK